MRDCLLATVFVLLAVLGQSRGQNQAKISCYDCMYYKGPSKTETNPNCREPDYKAPVAEGCTVCVKQVYMNDSRVYIHRTCSRFCNAGNKVPITHQDLSNVMATEYCCHTDQCNVGGDARSSHQVALLLLLAAAALGALVCL